MEVLGDIEVHVVSQTGTVEWSSNPNIVVPSDIVLTVQRALADAELCRFVAEEQSIAVVARILYGTDGQSNRYVVHVRRLPTWIVRSQLTRRQEQVAKLAARGVTVREMSRHLEISAHTVRTHLRNIYATLGVANRVELARSLSVLGYQSAASIKKGAQ